MDNPHLPSLGSDNHSGVHPALLKAIQDANLGHAPSYETDAWSERARTVFKEVFGGSSEPFFVFNGTAANVLALKACLPSYRSALCSSISHLFVDECGAPEAIGHFKLLPISHDEGKISLEDLLPAMQRAGDQHYAFPGLLSITQPTELGTVYTLKELRGLAEWSHRNGLVVHMDGARLCLAAAHLGCSLKELTTDVGIDVVSFGGSKNGFLFGEAVVFTNSQLAHNFKYLKKQNLQLASKTRFIAAQFIAYFNNGLWLQIARQQLKLAQRLAEGLKPLRQFRVCYPAQSNAVFVQMPKSFVRPLRKRYFFYVWDPKETVARLMVSFDTTAEQVDDFVNLAKEMDSHQATSP